MQPDTKLLETYLHEHIPITRSMGVIVSRIESDLLELKAPIDPNINHRETIFGGSASAVAILSAWGLVHFRLLNENINSRLVIQKNSMNYLKPMESNFSSQFRISDQGDWEKFIIILKRRQISRIHRTSHLDCRGEKNR